MKRSPLQRWFGFEHLEARQHLAAISWDGGGGDLSWHNPLNWSSDVLPGPNDDVTINVAGAPTIVHDQGVNTSVRTLISSEAIALSNGVFSVGVLWRQNAPFTMIGGALEGAGNLALAGGSDWSGGIITGDGRLQVLAGGELRITGSVLLERDVVNNGAISWESGDVDARGVTIYNLRGRTFTMSSPGTFSSGGDPSVILNGGTIAREGNPGTTTTVEITLNNNAGPTLAGSPLPGPMPGIVDVRSGTLSLTGHVVQKQGEYLMGGHWHVTSSDATLLLPGQDLIAVGNGTGEEPRILLRGAGASFPQLETSSAIPNLRLEGGRAFTFDEVWFTFTSLEIANPGTTHLNTGAAARTLTVESGTVVARVLNAQRVVIGAGATYHLAVSGFMQDAQSSITGPGTLRISGELVFRAGEISGGPLVIGPTGTMRIESDWQGPGRMLTRRTVNYGTVRFGYSDELLFAGEFVNRGTMWLGVGGIRTGGPGPAWIHNYGNVIKNLGGEFTLRAIEGGVRYVNRGTTLVENGRLNLYGGTLGGGNWSVSQGSELAIGGAVSSSLTGAFISAAGLLRIGARVVWTNGTMFGAGGLVIGPTGSFETAGSSNSIQRGSTVNNGTVKVLSGGQVNSTEFWGLFTNSGTFVLAGSASFGNGFTAADTSVLRVRSTGPGAHGYMYAGPVHLAGTLIVDFDWQAPAGTQFDFLNTEVFFQLPGEFASVQSTGLGAGRTAQFSWWSYRTSLYGRITVV
jgi:hypothetical protein